MPNWHSLTHAYNSKKLGAKLLLLMCFESVTKWLYPKRVQVLKTADKNGYIGLFRKCVIALEKLFCFGCRWISRNTGRQNQKQLILFVKVFWNSSVLSWNFCSQRSACWRCMGPSYCLLRSNKIYVACLNKALSDVKFLFG